MIDFIGIGAQKSATTWMYWQLSRHPQVWFPGIKEMHYWDSNPHGDGADWLAPFQQAPEGRIKGEYTPAYATLDTVTIERIAALCPDLRLIYLLRNPVERAWSQARMLASQGWLNLDNRQEIEEFLVSERCRSRGRYSQTICRWSEVFGREALSIHLFEDIASEPDAVLHAIAGHLGITAEGFHQEETDMFERIHVGAPIPIPAFVRDFLHREYVEEVARTADLIGRPLDHWLKEYVDA